jgi:hypothetical protein
MYTVSTVYIKYLKLRDGGIKGLCKQVKYNYSINDIDNNASKNEI